MRRGFTLIELLVVIAIIAILAVVVVLTLNPGQLILQARDSTRVSDLASLQDAIGLYITDAAVNGTVSLGSVNTVYVSIPDPTATTTLGDQCQGLGLLSLPSPYAYHCAASSTFRMNDSTGWIPINFKNMSTGGSLGQLPQDPINSSSSRTYETYTTDGSHYEVTAALESQKYKLGGTNDLVGTDGGTLATVYEKGTKLGLEPLDYGDSSLVGLWTFDEGAGTVAYDYSGNGQIGNFQNNPTWVSSGCEINGCIDFNGTNDKVQVPLSSIISPPGNYTLATWFNAASTTIGFFVLENGQYGFEWKGTGSALQYYDSVYLSSAQTSWSLNTWYYVTMVKSGSAVSLYINGVLDSIGTGGTHVSSGGLYFGKALYSFVGMIDDARLYNRALSASEIQAMYNGGK